MKSINRKDFLKRLSLFGAGAVALPATAARLGDPSDFTMDEPSNEELLQSGGCSPMPPETAGPYTIPNGVSAASLVRSDITEGSQTGVPLTLNLAVINAQDNCQRMQGMRVDLWHCNQRGYYSGYDGQPGIDGTQNLAGTTWLRGIQYTDGNGEVTFTTVYPGWYPGRATHLHIQIFDGANNLLSTTQLAFLDSVNTDVNNHYATSGTNPTTNTNDGPLSDSYMDELVTLTGDINNGFVGSMEMAVNGGVTGVEVDPQTGGQFSLLATVPNPFQDHTYLVFDLVQPSEVSLEVFDVRGRKVKNVRGQKMGAGRNSLGLDTSKWAVGSYYGHLRVSNVTGSFQQVLRMVKARP